MIADMRKALSGARGDDPHTLQVMQMQVLIGVQKSLSAPVFGTLDLTAHWIWMAVEL